MADMMIRTSTRTIKGMLRAVDLERNNCVFDERLEWQIKDAFDREVEATGEVINPASNGGSSKARWFRIEKAEKTESEDGEFDFEAAGLEPMSPKEILESGLVGMWKDRTDMEDVDEYMRRLRGGEAKEKLCPK